MKICVPAVSDNLEAQMDPRFGRCPYFLIVDSETQKIEAFPNVSVSAMSGAGIQAAQIIANKKVDVLITGNVGLNALQALSTAGMKVVTCDGGTVKAVLERYQRGELKEVNTPTVQGHFGMGRGRRT